MKNILCFILVLILFTSCSYDTMHTQYMYVSVASESLFVVMGQAYVAYRSHLPIVIYNPNNYPITVTADKIDYLIAPLDTLELQDFDK